jgi:alpha-ketoglutarate-dependent 2,4-dichlorophenoxyacetate dioxygenase
MRRSIFAMHLDHMKNRVYETTCPPRPGTDAIGPIQEGVLTIKPVFESGASSFGAEIYGVDWSKPVPSEVVAQVSLDTDDVMDIT